MEQRTFLAYLSDGIPLSFHGADYFVNMIRRLLCFSFFPLCFGWGRGEGEFQHTRAVIPYRHPGHAFYPYSYSLLTRK